MECLTSLKCPWLCLQCKRLLREVTPRRFLPDPSSSSPRHSIFFHRKNQYSSILGRNLVLFPLGLIAPWLQDQPLIIKFWAWFEILARSLDLVFLLRKAPMHMFAGCQACFSQLRQKWHQSPCIDVKSSVIKALCGWFFSITVNHTCCPRLTIDLGPAIKLTGILPTFMRSKWPQFKMRRISYPHLRI